jgi:hypothetical protein
MPFGEVVCEGVCEGVCDVMRMIQLPSTCCATMLRWTSLLPP